MTEQHPLTEQMIQDALDAIDTDRPLEQCIVWVDEEELKKFSELTKDISPERRERIEKRKSKLRPQEDK